MELVSVGDYKKRWAQKLAIKSNDVKINENANRYTPSMIIKQALDILYFHSQSLMFPFIDKNPIIIGLPQKQHN